MRAPFRYVLYMVIGFLIYQVIDSGETSLTHEEVRTTLIGGLLVVFVLLLVLKVIKTRHDDKK